ncbi:MAG: carbonic anhydrase [Clostridia bacterium]|nr:carbonic anhydrase [Clostridia bacterium]
MQQEFVSASAALQRLKDGNKIYLNAKTGSGDISPEIRLYTSKNGQKPYAAIVSCSDSRVIPEYIFSAGLGELFVVRVAGNVIDNHQLGSIEYAVEHLGCKLVVVLGHTKCGAVGAASQKNSGYVGFIADEIRRAIGEEKDAVKASILNVRQSVLKIENILNNTEGLQIIGALYHTESGAVDFDISGKEDI